MNSLYDFIITPAKERYNNTKKIGDKTLILNTSIEDFKAISKEGIVLHTPLAIKSPIKVGDHVMVHHNIFRRFYNIKGKEQNSRSYFKEDMYFCSIDQLYLYKQNNEWNGFLDRCFVQPIKETDSFKINSMKPNIGIVKYTNKHLEKLGIKVGSLVSFKKGREFEFVIDNELLYCMKLNDIVIEHEYEGNEEKYNPSWTRCS